MHHPLVSVNEKKIYALIPELFYEVCLWETLVHINVWSLCVCAYLFFILFFYAFLIFITYTWPSHAGSCWWMGIKSLSGMYLSLYAPYGLWCFKVYVIRKRKIKYTSNQILNKDFYFLFSSLFLFICFLIEVTIAYTNNGCLWITFLGLPLLPKD